MIQLHREITISAEPDAVWAVLSEPDEVVMCIPGATLDRIEDEEFEGQLTVRFGALRVPFRGKGHLTLDHQNRRGRIEGRGRDSTGGTGFRAEAAFSLREAVSGGPTGVLIDLLLEVSGKLATTIEAGANVVAEALLGEFAREIAARVGVEPAPVSATGVARDHSAFSIGLWARAIAAGLRYAFRASVDRARRLIGLFIGRNSNRENDAIGGESAPKKSQ